MFTTLSVVPVQFNNFLLPNVIAFVFHFITGLCSFFQWISAHCFGSTACTTWWLFWFSLSAALMLCPGPNSAHKLKRLSGEEKQFYFLLGYLWWRMLMLLHLCWICKEVVVKVVYQCCVTACCNAALTYTLFIFFNKGQYPLHLLYWRIVTGVAKFQDFQSWKLSLGIKGNKLEICKFCRVAFNSELKGSLKNILHLD